MKIESVGRIFNLIIEKYLGIDIGMFCDAIGVKLSGRSPKMVNYSSAFFMISFGSEKISNQNIVKLTI